MLVIAIGSDVNRGLHPKTKTEASDTLI